MNKLIKTFFFVAISIMFCRFSGFFRDLMIATKFSASYVEDAFIAIFRLTNLSRNIFTENSFSSNLGQSSLCMSDSDDNYGSNDNFFFM